MASRQMIESMITSFCDLYGKRQERTLVDSWLTALSRYEDDRVQIGGQKAMEECTRMPTPSDIISRMPNVTDEHLPYVLEQGRKCGLCGYMGMCIKEEPFSDTWRCRQCYSGLTKEQHAARMKSLVKIMSKEGKHESIGDRPRP